MPDARVLSMHPHNVKVRERRARLIREGKCITCGGPKGLPTRKCMRCQVTDNKRVKAWAHLRAPGASRANGSLGRFNRKRRAVAFLGGACLDCGLKTNSFCVYDFDHRDGDDKVTDLNTLIKRAGWSRIEKELVKTDLVCANCHRIRTVERSLQCE